MAREKKRKIVAGNWENEHDSKRSCIGVNEKLSVAKQYLTADVVYCVPDDIVPVEEPWRGWSREHVLRRGAGGIS